VRECSSVFTELDAALTKTKKNALGRLMLPFRESKIELLRRHIDTLKSTLQLLLHVLTHAQQIAAQKLDREAEAEQRKQIKALLLNKKESAERYEDSLRNYSISEGSTVVHGDDDDDDDDDDEDDDGKSDKRSQQLTIRSDTFITSSAGPNITIRALEECVEHIQGLLDDIEALQNALSKEEEDLDRSMHHQSVIGSYFRARHHLDSVFLGNPRSSKTSQDKAENISTDPAVQNLGKSSDLWTTTFEELKDIPDEKRKRNVGASARFRARRKEKERDVIRLNEQLQEALEAKRRLTSANEEVGRNNAFGMLSAIQSEPRLQNCAIGAL
jgi:hypothetical protein